MQLTIVSTNDLVVIDRICQNFPLEPFNPPADFQVLQWHEYEGQIEYSDRTLDPINELPGWALAIVDEFDRYRSVNQDTLATLQRSERAVVNGTARLDRNRQRQVDTAMKHMAELADHLQRQLNKNARKAMGRNARIQLVSLNRTIEVLNEITRIK